MALAPSGAAAAPHEPELEGQTSTGRDVARSERPKPHLSPPCVARSRRGRRVPAAPRGDQGEQSSRDRSRHAKETSRECSPKERAEVYASLAGAYRKLRRRAVTSGSWKLSWQRRQRPRSPRPAVGLTSGVSRRAGNRRCLRRRERLLVERRPGGGQILGWVFTALATALTVVAVWWQEVLAASG